MQEASDILVCGFSADKNRFSMQDQFTQESLKLFFNGFINKSLQPFLHSGHCLDHKLLLPAAKQLNAYQFAEEAANSSDTAILLLADEDRSASDKLVQAFQAVAKKLSKEIDFVWMCLRVNEIPPQYLDRFRSEKTSIYIRSDSSTVKFSPVSNENNLENLLFNFIKQRKLYLNN